MDCLPYVPRFDKCPECGGRIQYRPITCTNGAVQYRCECLQPPCRWWTNVPHAGNDKCSEINRRNRWARKVKARDGYVCQRCGSTEDLEAHHKVPYAGNLSLRYDVDNGITLCRNCHNMEHPWRNDKDWKAAKA